MGLGGPLEFAQKGMRKWKSDEDREYGLKLRYEVGKMRKKMRRERGRRSATKGNGWKSVIKGGGKWKDEKWKRYRSRFEKWVGQISPSIERRLGRWSWPKWKGGVRGVSDRREMWKRKWEVKAEQLSTVSLLGFQRECCSQEDGWVRKKMWLESCTTRC